MAIERCCVPTWKTRLCLPHGVDQHAAFADVERQRLFGVDVLAGLAGVDAGQHPLELARADDHRVDVFAFQKLAVVLIDGPVALSSWP